ncbi:hypothetical protein QBC36DRAFT_339479 [Triangularia setosa]|uniref:Uncharacterized protein n=1 Tax=Triangularia setosa TaxID=2587417 RepID=A0AAN7A368_9PEZI|nr:hypothetical protein QBC36DRAFT_339479 [Podospora setosa]
MGYGVVKEPVFGVLSLLENTLVKDETPKYLDTTCLTIFDNADDLTTLKTAWPGSIGGSIPVTTRDLSVATIFDSSAHTSQRTR